MKHILNPEERGLRAARVLCLMQPDYFWATGKPEDGSIACHLAAYPPPLCRACNGTGGFNRFVEVPMGGTGTDATETIHQWIQCSLCLGTGRETPPGATEVLVESGDCFWATGPHHHKIEGGREICLASEIQRRKYFEQ